MERLGTQRAQAGAVGWGLGDEFTNREPQKEAAYAPSDLCMSEEPAPTPRRLRDPAKSATVRWARAIAAEPGAPRAALPWPSVRSRRARVDLAAVRAATTCDEKPCRCARRDG